MQVYDYLIWAPTDYIAHEGILKMKWGVRNGPPYPLKREQMSSAERKANPVSDSAKKKSKSAKTDFGIRDDDYEPTNESDYSGKSKLRSKLTETMKWKTDTKKAVDTEEKKTDTKKAVDTEEKKTDSVSKKTNTTKSVKEMSDSELTAAIKRLENEKKYAELTSKSSEKKKTSLGEQILKDVTKNVATQTLTNIGSQTGTYVLGVEINKLLKKYNAKNDIDDDQSINPKKGQKDK